MLLGLWVAVAPPAATQQVPRRTGQWNPDSAWASIASERSRHTRAGVSASCGSTGCVTRETWAHSRVLRLTWLAVERRVAASTQVQAQAAPVSLYWQVLGRPLQLAGIVPRARGPPRPAAFPDSAAGRTLGQGRSRGTAPSNSR